MGPDERVTFQKDGVIWKVCVVTEKQSVTLKERRIYYDLFFNTKSDLETESSFYFFDKKKKKK